MILSPVCNKVIGVEIVEQAVKDAELNAKENCIENIEFIASPVQKVINQVISKCENEVLVVLDPPRNGVPQSVILSLRSSSSIKKLIYISCQLKTAMQNIQDLLRASSNKFTGEPFKISRVIPVDLFPSTSHYEVIILFER